MSVTNHPFLNREEVKERNAEIEQQAAIDAFRARAMQAKTPMVPLPFGRQRRLDSYVGLRVLPFIKNPFVSDPSVLLENPDPTAHYGLAKRDDPEVRGKIRAGIYEDVYIDELRSDNSAGIGISAEEYPRAAVEIEGVLTERGPSRLVLWHGLQLVKIPHKTWVEMVEEPALMGSARLAMHQEAFENFSFRPVTTEHGDFRGTDVATHGDSQRGYGDMRGKVQATMTMEA